MLIPPEYPARLARKDPRKLMCSHERCRETLAWIQYLPGIGSFHEPPGFAGERHMMPSLGGKENEAWWHGRERHRRHAMERAQGIAPVIYAVPGFRYNTDLELFEPVRAAREAYNMARAINGDTTTAMRYKKPLRRSRPWYERDSPDPVRSGPEPVVARGYEYNLIPEFPARFRCPRCNRISIIDSVAVIDAMLELIPTE